MTDFLPFLVLFMILIVALGAFNDRVTKLTYEIALMLFSIGVGGILLIVSMNMGAGDVKNTIDQVLTFDLDDYLMKGVLCFMLFAGSCHMRVKDFEKFWRQISVLSIIATLLGAIFYGLLFYLVSAVLHLGFTLPMCLMFGSIVAPTDPIAATSILKKFGLPKHISFLIEGESLLNDGVGVALFVCFSGMVKASGGEENVLLIMLREILGAAVVGIAVTAVFFCPTVDSRAQSWRFILLTDTVSASSSVISPTPARAMALRRGFGLAVPVRLLMRGSFPRERSSWPRPRASFRPRASRRRWRPRPRRV